MMNCSMTLIGRVTEKLGKSTSLFVAFDLEILSRLNYNGLVSSLYAWSQTVVCISLNLNYDRGYKTNERTKSFSIGGVDF